MCIITQNTFLLEVVNHTITVFKLKYVFNEDLLFCCWLEEDGDTTTKLRKRKKNHYFVFRMNWNRVQLINNWFHFFSFPKALGRFSSLIKPMHFIQPTEQFHIDNTFIKFDIVFSNKFTKVNQFYRNYRNCRWWREPENNFIWKKCDSGLEAQKNYFLIFPQCNSIWYIPSVSKIFTFLYHN